MKILVIDNLFVPSKAGKIGNGAQKFTRNQVSILGDLGNDVYYITAAGSDYQFTNQFILKEHFDLTIPDKKDRAAQTKRIANEIENLCKRIKPDIVLDSAGRHMSSIWSHYGNGIIFEHYYKSSAPLGEDGIKKFESKNVIWCGVSKFQKKAFRDLFHETINIHVIDRGDIQIQPHNNYGIFVSRWDGGKNPHVALRNYVKSETNIPLKCFIKFEGEGIKNEVLEELKKSPLLEFHIDAPRDEIVDAMSKAAFCYGAGNESTGIVSLECATFGVPYIVTAKNKEHLAEREHMPDKYMFVNERSNEEVPVPEQLKKNIDFCMKLEYNSRIELSNIICNKFTPTNFAEEHYRVIDVAKNLYKAGNSLNEFF